MKNLSDLKRELEKIDGRGYKTYKTLEGQYSFEDYILSIDHVQGDPFASPSRLRIIINKNKAKFPEGLIDKDYKKIAVCDFLTRLFYFNINKFGEKIFGSGKSGLIAISRCPQEILERTSVIINNDSIEARFYVGFPAKGRTVLARDISTVAYARKHLNVNILGFGGRITGVGLMENMVDIFLDTKFEPTNEDLEVIKKLDSIAVTKEDEFKNEHFFDEFLEKWDKGEYHD